MALLTSSAATGTPNTVPIPPAEFDNDCLGGTWRLADHPEPETRWDMDEHGLTVRLIDSELRDGCGTYQYDVTNTSGAGRSFDLEWHLTDDADRELAVFTTGSRMSSGGQSITQVTFTATDLDGHASPSDVSMIEPKVVPLSVLTD